MTPMLTFGLFGCGDEKGEKSVEVLGLDQDDALVLGDLHVCVAKHVGQVSLAVDLKIQ